MCTLGPADLKTGDEVSYVPRLGKKGIYASALMRIDPASIQRIPSLTGEITKEFDVYRHTFGVIKIDPSAAIAPIAIGALSITSYPYHHPPPSAARKHSKGDEVSFTLCFIPGTGYCIAADVNITMSKREKLRQKEIKDLLDSGMQLEQGIIDSVFGDFGFISPLNSADKIYFKSADLPGEEPRKVTYKYSLATSEEVYSEEEEEATMTHYYRPNYHSRE